MNKQNQNKKFASILALFALPVLLAACGSNASFGSSGASSASSLSSSSTTAATGTPATTTSTPVASTAYSSTCSGPIAAATPALSSGGVCAVKVMNLSSEEGLMLSIPDNGSSTTSLAECKQVAQQFQANYSNVCTYYITVAQAQAVGVSYTNAAAAVQAIIQNYAPVASSN